MVDIDALCSAAIAGDVDAIAMLEMEAEKGSTTILHAVAEKGDIEHVRFIVRNIANKKNLWVKLDGSNNTALHTAVYYRQCDVVEVLIDGARQFFQDNNVSSSFPANEDKSVSSFQAYIRQVNIDSATALSYGVWRCCLRCVKMLVEADPTDRHTLNYQGKSPLYRAAQVGYNDIVEMICTTCTAPSLDGPGGSTALHAALDGPGVKEKDTNVISRMIINVAKRSCTPPYGTFEDLFNQTDKYGRTVLELAVIVNQVNVVDLILKEDPAYQHTGQSKAYHRRNSLFYALILAIKRRDKAKEEDIDVIKMIMDAAKRLCTPPYGSFEDLFKQTDELGHTILQLALKGNQVNVVDLILKEDPAYQQSGRSEADQLFYALILAIERRDKDSVLLLLGYDKHLATFAEDEGWTALHYAAYHEFDSILDTIIEAQKDLGYQFVYKDKVQTPLLVAAEKGYTSTVIRLMKLWPTSSSAYTAINNNGKNILHLAAAENKKEMIEGILKYCPEKYKDNLLKRQDANGDTPLHLLISHGCFIPELIKHKGLDTMVRNKRNWTPRDMLYSTDDIIADQVKIKIALDYVQTDQSRKFWRKNMKKETDISESSVPPSKRAAKDVKYRADAKRLNDEKRAQMKKDLERYKKRTSTQIIVATLITTVTFTVGFTMPGGLRQSGEVNEGLVVLEKKAAFNAFMVSDALAFLLSTCSLFLYFLESMYEDPHQVSILNAASVGLNIISVMAMMLTFITGTYVVLSHSPALAVTVCLIGSFFFIFVIVLLIKMVYDRQVNRNIED